MHNEIEIIHLKIAQCHICPKMDKIKHVRNPLSVGEKTPVFILSQSLAESQLRKSGVNFFKQDGNLGSTGKQLEKFLNKINQTVFPPHDIRLDEGIVISKRKPEFYSVYNTEITHCYPGKAKLKGDRIPDKLEITNCLEQGFLFSEINLIKPKLILLMGKLSIKTFYKYILNQRNDKSITDLIYESISSNSIPKFNFGNLDIGFLPIQHASGANPLYNKMIKNEGFINLINNYLIS